MKSARNVQLKPSSVLIDCISGKTRRCIRFHRFLPFVHKFNQDKFYGYWRHHIIRNINQSFVLVAEEDLESRNMYRREN